MAYVFTSCDEVIEVDLNESDPKVVIEAILKDQSGGNQVIISQTGSYFDPGTYPPVEGAMVKLIDQEGNEEILTESEPGTYPIIETQAKAGMTYRLEVTSEGEEYVAQSSMQTPFQIDSINFQVRNTPFGGGGEDDYAAIVFLTDEAGVDIFLLFDAVVNGEVQPDLFLYDGRQTDGEESRVPFFTLELKKGDQIKVNTYAIDQETYDYYNTLVDLVSGGFGGTATTPANPNSNWSNDALGFFGTLAVSELEAVVE